MAYKMLSPEGECILYAIYTAQVPNVLTTIASVRGLWASVLDF